MTSILKEEEISPAGWDQGNPSGGRKTDKKKGRDSPAKVQGASNSGDGERVSFVCTIMSTVLRGNHRSQRGRK